MMYKELLLSYRAGEISKESLKDRLAALHATQKSIPLSEGQRGLWSISKNKPNTTAYNVPVCLRIDSEINTLAVEQSCKFLLTKHSILSSKIVIEDGGLVFNKVNPENFKLGVVELSGNSEPENRQVIQGYIEQPFDLDEGPLLKVFLFTVSNSHHYLLFVAHHIAFDGMSAVTFIKEFLQVYGHKVNGEPITDLRAKGSYGDFVRWENDYLKSEECVEHLEFWEAEYKAGIPQVRVPGDLEGDPDKGSAYHAALVVGDQAAGIKRYCDEHNISRSTFFLAAFNGLVAAHCGLNTAVVGMPVMVRPQIRFDELVGYFVNVLPLCSRDLNTRTFQSACLDVSQKIFEITDHAVYPFPKMVKEMGFKPGSGQSSFFHVMYAYQNFLDAAESSADADAPIDVSLEADFQQGTDFDLALEVCETKDGFKLMLKFASGLYSQSWAINFLNELTTFLAQTLAEDGDLPAVYNLRRGDRCASSAGRSPVGFSRKSPVGVIFGPDTPSNAENICLHEIFVERAATIPEKIGLVCEGREYTYAEIDALTDALALRLIERGVHCETRVGLCMDRSADVVFAILAVLKAGGVYVPLDATHPQKRLQYVIEDCKPLLILTDKRHLGKLAFVEEIPVAPTLHTLSGLSAMESDVVSRHESRELLLGRTSPDNLAYILYTSGSTGTPKGVMVEHRNILNTLFALENRYPVKDGSRYLFKTNYIFDVSVAEIFGWYMGCGTLIVLPRGFESEPAKMLDVMATQSITHVNFVPSMLNSFLSALDESDCLALDKLSYLFVAGEAFTPALMRLCRSRLPGNVKVENIYGPTEVSIYATWFSLELLETSAEFVPIGKPLPNVNIAIINESGELCEPGIPGELCVSGAGVARGYWNKPDLSAQKFIVSDIFDAQRLYKTGDKVARLDDGNIQYLGRIDDQVKIRGYRIELGAIEACLQDHTSIEQCAVVVHESAHNKQLVAYFTRNKQAQESHEINRATLRDYAAKHLPEYMIPPFFIELESIPLTSTGKVDRKLLAQKSIDLRKQVQQTEVVSFERSAIERELTSIWEKILSVKNISPDDGFFVVGGDSVNLTMMIKTVNTRFNCKLVRTDVFEHSDIRSLAGFIFEHTHGRRKLGTVRPGIKTTHENIVQLKHEAPAQARSAPFDAGRTAKLTSDTIPDYYQNCLAIVGMSGTFPGAESTDEFWGNLLSGKESVRVLSVEELREAGVSEALLANPNYVPVQAAVANKAGFDPEFFNITPKDAELIDPQYRHLLMHSWKAIEDAGYCVEQLTNTGVFVSAGMSFYQALAGGDRNSNANALELNVYSSWVLSQSGTAPTMISHKLGLKGPSVFVHTNCSSSLIALDSAAKSILSGDCDQALVGAASILANQVPGYIHQPGMNFSSDGHLRAFDENADGMVAGEGVAVLLLKRADKAIADGDNVYAVIRGIAINNDGADKVGYYAPGYRGQTEVIANCLKKTGISPGSIEYVEAHGTGTKLGDPVEVKAISDVYRRFTEDRQFCAIGSAKSNIGHLDSAAGLAGLVKVALSLKHGTIPPTINCENPNSEIPFSDSPFYLATKARQYSTSYPCNRAALSSFGLGGTNTHAILESLPNILQAKNSTEQAPGELLFPVSAKTVKQLHIAAERLRRYLGSDSSLDLVRVSYTLQTGRAQMPCRVCFVASDLKQLMDAIAAYLAGEQSASVYISSEVNQASSDRSYFEDDDARLLFTEWCKLGQWDKLARVWATGVKFEWLPLWEIYGSSVKPTRLSLPTYPFALTPYWLGARAADKQQNASNLTTPGQIKKDKSPELTSLQNSEMGISEIDQAQESELSDNRHESTNTGHNSEVVAHILEALASATGIDSEEIDLDADLIELGLDSLAFLTVVKLIQDKYCVTISQTQLFDELNTLRKIADYVNAQARRSVPDDDRLEDLSSGNTASETSHLEKLSPKAALEENHYQTVKPSSITSQTKNQKRDDTGLRELFTHNYVERTSGSRRSAEKNRRHLADSRAVAGLRPDTKAFTYPIVGTHADGSYFTDIDGNQFMDISMGFGVLLFGHKPPFVEKALIEQIQNGLQIGPQSRLAGEVATLICELTGVERVAFCNTGSEAVMVALRLAKAATGKSTIAVFKNSYHGHFDGVLPSLSESTEKPNIVELEYGEDSALHYIAQNADLLAGVIVEPVQSRRPELQPKDFIHKLRALTLEVNVPLIFDEVLTGFRILPGGAQQYFGVQADIVTYGKIIGGGLPVAAVAGKSKYMDMIDGGQWRFDDESLPASKRIMFVGTYNKNSLAMAASYSVLKEIKSQGEAMYSALNERTHVLVESLNAAFENLQLPVEVVHFGSLFRFKSNRNLEPFYQQLIYRGVYVWEGRNCFIATSMDERFIEQLQQIILAAAQATFGQTTHASGLPNASEITRNDSSPPGKNRENAMSYSVEAL